jgi:N-acyl-D-aspartate/D-glutamate deacylase
MRSGGGFVIRNGTVFDGTGAAPVRVGARRRETPMIAV